MKHKCNCKCQLQVFYALYYKEKDRTILLPVYPRKHVVIYRCTCCGQIVVKQ